jgi:streptomycin adenylyltransferase
MESLLATARDDDRIRVVVVGCSIGRGAGDELSDVDALIGVRADAWDASLADSRRWIERAGKVLDMHQMLMPEGAASDKQHQYSYVQYANGVEVDLNVSRVRDDWRRRADWVVLYDVDGAVPNEITRPTPTVDDLHRWGYAVFTRLGAVAKYATRGALWEAHNVLELARADVWRLWAVAEGVPDAEYGVTAVFDDPRRPVPPAMTRTIPAGLEKMALVAAAIACCDLAMEVWPRAMAAIDERGGALPPLASHVRERLRKVATG